MPKTVSVHNGSAANREHNRRNPRTTGQMPHIQQDLVHHNETWIDIPVREAYSRFSRLQSMITIVVSQDQRGRLEIITIRLGNQLRNVPPMS